MSSAYFMILQKGRRLVVYTNSPKLLVSVGDASKLINNKLGTHVLHISIIGVGKMFSINALPIVGANTITLQRSKVSKPDLWRKIRKVREHVRGRKRLGF
jgi:hypothetical protein